MDIYLDRTRVETDWACRRKRWWLTEWAGPDGIPRGLVPSREPYYYAFGSLIHKGLEGLLRGLTTAEVVAWARGALADWTFGSPEERQQQTCLAVGLLAGYARAMLPDLLTTHEVVWTEEELTLETQDGPDTLHWMVRPDAVVQHHQTGALTYLEFKTTGSVSPAWLAQWATKPQLWLGPWALEQTLGQPIEQTQVQGLYKGYLSKGEWRSPLVTAYEGPQVVRGVEATGPPRWSTEWKRDWVRRSTADYPGGTEAWVEAMPLEVLKAQFPRPAPVFTNQPAFEAFLRQTTIREREIWWARGKPPEVKENLFAQNFSECTPGFGSACPYERACWMPQVGRDPLGSGYYRVRQPHHTQEPTTEREDQP